MSSAKLCLTNASFSIHNFNFILHIDYTLSVPNKQQKLPPLIMLKP